MGLSNQNTYILNLNGSIEDQNKKLRENLELKRKQAEEDLAKEYPRALKSFNKDANDVEDIIDKLVIVGNNFPISVQQISEGMTNASSALSAAGNSFEQSVALMTAANTTIQNASKSSTGLRTIAARLRNTKAELDDLGEAMTLLS